MEKNEKRLLEMITRYVFILLLGLGNLFIFYEFFTPITIKTLSFVLSIFKEIVVTGMFIDLGSYTVAIVPACVAGAAYYLLLILIFSTAEISLGKRLLLTLAAFITFFILNIGRILILIVLIGKPFFAAAHWVMWNLVSTLFVVGIWIVLVKVYKIKSIPLYSDFRYTMDELKKSQHPRKKR